MSESNDAQVKHSLAETTWIRLMRVYLQIDKRTADLMKAHGISTSRFDVLVHAGVRDGRTQQELADAMFVTKGNITQLLDGMEKDDLLYRRRRGRTNLIYLTEKGRELRELAMSNQLNNLESSFDVLTSEEQHTLGKLLRKVDRAIAQLNKPQRGSS